jgi:hypothetical protein
MPVDSEQMTALTAPKHRPRGAGRHPAVPEGTRRLTGTLTRILEAGYGFIRVAPPDEREGEYYINIHSMRDKSAWQLDAVLSFLPGVAREGKATPAYDARQVGRNEKGNRI